MLTELRHTVILLTISFLTAACDSNEPADTESDAAMKFEVASLSRAVLATADNFKQNPFAVYADKTFGTTIPVFNGETVTFHSSLGCWTYSGTQYWFPKHEYSFIALYPAELPDISDIDYSDSKLEFTYSYPAKNYSDAKDLMISTHRRKYNSEETATPVRFTFAHILSNVNVSVAVKESAPDAAPIQINGLTFKNIPIRATYSVTPAQLDDESLSTDGRVNGDDTFGGWKVDEKGDVEISFSEANGNFKEIPLDTKPHYLFSNDDALLLLPNPYESTELILSYTTFTESGAVSSPKTATVTIPKEWKPGTSMSLALTIINQKIQFSFSVAEWKAADNPINSTVPR